MKLYKACVAPVINYGISVWYPSTNSARLEIENIQRSFTRRFLDRRDYNYLQRMDKLYLRSVKETVLIHDLLLFYQVHRIPQSKFSVYFKNCPFLFIDVYKRSLRNRDNRFYLSKPRMISPSFESSWYFRTFDVWNALSENTAGSNSISQFKHRLINNDLPSLRDRFCSDYLSNFQ